MKKFVKNINDNVHKVKTELNHLGIVSICVILSLVFYTTGINLGFDVLQSTPFALIIGMGTLVIIGIIYEIYLKIGRGE